MAHKTFISYKYSDSQELRDKIIKRMGNDATYYSGERSDSPDLTDFTTATIKEHLKNMIHDTSVTIVLYSPKMNQSKWIPWEIQYSLSSITRDDKTSRPNGIILVIPNTYKGWDQELIDCFVPEILKKNEPYIYIVRESTVMTHLSEYIDKAYNRSLDSSSYNLVKRQ